MALDWTIRLHELQTCAQYTGIPGKVAELLE